MKKSARRQKKAILKSFYFEDTIGDFVTFMEMCEQGGYMDRGFIRVRKKSVYISDNYEMAYGEKIYNILFNDSDELDLTEIDHEIRRIVKKLIKKGISEEVFYFDSGDGTMPIFPASNAEMFVYVTPLDINLYK